MKIRFSAKVKMYFSSVYEKIKEHVISITNKIFILLDIHNKSWKQILKEKKLFFIFAGFVLFLYIAPYFVVMNKYKENIENKINTTFNVVAKINGNVSYAILPKPVILLRNVEIQDKTTEKKLIKIHKLLLNVSIFSLFTNDIVVKDAYFIDPIFYPNFNKVKKDTFVKIIDDNLLDRLSVQKGKIIVEKDKIIDNFDLFLDLKHKEKIKLKTSLKYFDAKFKNFNALVSYKDIYNYDISGSGNIVDNKTNAFLKILLKMQDDEPTILGNVDFNTSHLKSFLEKFFPRFTPPQNKFFTSKLNVKFDIQNNKNTILVKNGTIEARGNKGTFDGGFLIKKAENENNNLNIKLNFFELPDLEQKNQHVFNFPLTFLKANEVFLQLLQYAKLDISIDKVMFNKQNLTKFNFKTTPIFTEDKFSGFDIDNLSYIVRSKNTKITGRATEIYTDNTKIDTKIDTKIPFILKNIFIPKFSLTEFVGGVVFEKDKITLDEVNLKTKNDSIVISGEIKKYKNWDFYDLMVKGDSFNLDKQLEAKVDFAYILKRLSNLKNTNLKLDMNIKNLKLNKKDYKTFQLKTIFQDGNLLLDKLHYFIKESKTIMNGGLNGLFSNNGQFDNFNYSISNFKESGVDIPFIKNEFLDKLFVQGVNDVKVMLNGDANNPDANVDIKLKQIQLKMNGKLLNKNSDYSMLLYHNDLKGFLFSRGFLTSEIMDYFYDNVPFVFKGNVIGNNINDIKLQIRNDLLTGNLSFDNKDTTLSLAAENFDLKNILKRLKTKSDYSDFMLKFIQSVPVNLSLNIKTLYEYKNNIFTDVMFDLQNAVNPGSFKLKFKNGKNQLDLKTDILNSNAFDGNLKLKNYKLSNDILKNKIISLQDTNMNLDLTFKTFGLNTNSLISNLSGKYKIDLLKGKLLGISNYETILAGIFNLANMTTNAILGIIETSFKGGIVAFDKLTLNGELEMAKIKDSVFVFSVPNIDVSGSIEGDLISKSLKIESIFNFKELAPEILKVIYNLNGFTSNLTSKLDLTGIILKINPTYLQKKKRDLMIK